MNESTPSVLVGQPLRGMDFFMDPASPPAAASFRFDIRVLWSAVYRRRKMVAAILAAMLMGGLALTYLSAPVYRAGTKIQIEQQGAKVLDGDDVSPSEAAQDADRFLQTQLDVVRSRSLAERVAKALNLYSGTQFFEKTGVRPERAEDNSPDAIAGRREQVLDVLQDKLKVELPVDSRIATISFDSLNPEFSARVSNSFAENFIVTSMERKFNASSYARKFLQDQLEQTRQRLEQSERNLIDYSRAAGLIDASGGADQSGGAGSSGARSLVTSSLVQINRSFSDALAARLAAQQRWEAADRTPVMDLPEVLENPTIQNLVQQRARAQAQYQQDLQRWKPDYPEMLQQSAQIAEFDRQIERLATSIKKGIRERYQVAAAQEQALNRSLTDLKGATLAEQGRGVRYNILHREVDTNRALYDGLLQRFKEVSAASGVVSNNISIVDRAKAPQRPIWPRPLLNVAFALLAGVALSLLSILILEHLDDAVHSPEEVEGKLNVPLIGTTPKLLPGEEARDQFSDARSPLSEAYYAIRTSLEFSSDAGVPRIVLFTSSAAAEGKSTSAYATARAFAMIGRRVLLIDADMRKPSQHRLTGLGNEAGLANLLVRQRSVEEVVQKTAIENLDFISAGPHPINPAELLAGSGVAELLARMEAAYDLVVIDGPPVLGLADAPALAAIVPATIFVIEANRNHRGQAKVAIRRLKAARAHIIGAILSKYDGRLSGYSTYSYEYGRTN